MQNIKPKSIGQIYAEIREYVGVKWFRVRDVTTLRDFLVLDFSQIGFVMSDPRWADVVCCDDEMPSSRDCTERKYALLSSPAELASFRRHKKTAVMEQILHSYRLSKKAEKILDTDI